MNYAPNTRRWQPGDIVIHDADAKRSEMLMLVKGYHPVTGECITRYLQREYLPGMKKRCLNDIRYLHDPRQFGLQINVSEQG